MKQWAEVVNGRVRHVFETADDFTPEFGPSILVVEITGRSPKPGEGWTYDKGADTFVFAPRPPPPAVVAAPPAVAAMRYRDPTAEAVRSLFAIGSTDVINVTETGKLLGILLRLNAGVSGTPTMRLEIVVDGGTQENIPVYSASKTWEPFFQRLVRVFNGSVVVNGDALNDAFYLWMDCHYKTSLIVRANCTGAGSGGGVDVFGIRATEQ